MYEEAYIVTRQNNQRKIMSKCVRMNITYKHAGHQPFRFCFTLGSFHPMFPLSFIYLKSMRYSINIKYLIKRDYLNDRSM